MSTTASTTPAPLKRRRWWIGPLWILLLGGCVCLGIFLFRIIAAENEWRRVEAELDALEPRWRLADLEADRPPIEEADNAGLQIMRAHAAAPKLVFSNAKDYDAIFAELTPTNQLNAQQIALIQGQLNTAPAALTEARKLKHMPQGRFAIKFSIDYIATQMPHHSDARVVAEWLVHDAYLLAQEGRCDAALDGCMAILSIGRTVGDDRTLIMHLVRMAQHRLAARTVERVLAQGESSQPRLEALQHLVARESAASSPTGSLKGERAGWHHLFENIRNGKLNRTYLRDLMRWRSSETLPERVGDLVADTMMDHAPDLLRLMNRRIEISQLPLHEQKARLSALAEDAKDNPLFPALNLIRVHEAELRSQALLRAALAALACERYRVEHKDWPATLDVLVTAKVLLALPCDPVDGQPLRYRRDVEGIVIYSLGIDEKDDGGNLIREPLTKETSLIQNSAAHEDIGIRLWHPALRRAAPLPVVVPRR